MRLPLAGVAALAVAVAAPAAIAQTGGTPAPKQVGANGNFLGGLSFTPAAVSVPVGGIVEWTNTDPLVPHTATEDHSLWDLGGSYGGTPVNPSGFGPGATVSRRFEAGLHSYYCRVHGRAMTGTVTVRPSLTREKKKLTKRVTKRVKRKNRKQGQSKYVRKKVKKRITRRYIVATWAITAPASGLTFDADRRRAGGAWRPLATGTRTMSARFRVRRGVVWEVRARLRRLSDATQATGWASTSLSG